MSSIADLFTPKTLEKTRESLTVNDSFVIEENEDYKLEVDVAKDRALISITDLYSNDQVGMLVDTEYFQKDYELLLLDINDLKDELISIQLDNNLDRSIF